MSNIATLPTARSVDEAWEAYRALRQREIDEPRLMVDRPHCEAVSLAWSAWRDLFLQTARRR